MYKVCIRGKTTGKIMYTIYARKHNHSEKRNICYTVVRIEKDLAIRASDNWFSTETVSVV
jgi:hypothetical protein